MSTPLKNALLDLLRHNQGEAGYYRARALAVWGKFFGKNVAEHTRDLMVRKGKLYVYVDNAPLRHQLTMLKDGIKKRLNEEFGEEYLQEVIIK